MHLCRPLLVAVMLASGRHTIAGEWPLPIFPGCAALDEGVPLGSQRGARSGGGVQAVRCAEGAGIVGLELGRDWIEALCCRVRAANTRPRGPAGC